MKLKQIASNMTELHLNNGTVVLFSYETPVAACIAKNGQFERPIRTKEYYSLTTTRHINKWFDHNHGYTTRCIFKAFDCNLVDQSVLDSLVDL